MRRIIFALLFSFSTAAAYAETAATGPRPIELSPDAPDRHLVVPGDTLWGIAAKFLKDPFRWPDLWKMNAEQVKNPHRIYPGQVVVLDRSGGDPRLRLMDVVKLQPQVKEKALQNEIAPIPPQAIEPFLAQPLVIDPTAFDNAPRVVATQENRVYAGNGDTIYVTGINTRGALWDVYRPGKPIIDPDSQELLGVEAIPLGTARLHDIAGDIATLTVLTIKQEIGRGDRLVPASPSDLSSYMPHEPARPVSGRILSIYGGNREGGGQSIVVLSRGARDGLEPGHVLAIYRAGITVTNRFDEGSPQSNVLPEERYGMMYVFRVFDRVAYALVMEAAKPVLPGDRVGQP